MKEFRQVAPLHAVQPPYNLFERSIEDDVLPYARARNVTVLAYGSLCRGLLTGSMSRSTASTATTCARAIRNFASRATRSILPPSRSSTSSRRRASAGASSISPCAGCSIRAKPTSPCGARGAPSQLAPIAEVVGWHIDEAAMEEIDRILEETIRDPVGPEFMAPPDRLAA